MIIFILSGSHDQTIKIWEWNTEDNTVSCKWICKGHKRSVDSLSSDPSGTRLASGSWDGELKIWSSSLEGLPENNKAATQSKKDEEDDEEISNSRVAKLIYYKYSFNTNS